MNFRQGHVTGTRKCTYIFLVSNKLQSDSSQVSQSLEFSFPKALVRLCEPNEIFRHSAEMVMRSLVNEGVRMTSLGNFTLLVQSGIGTTSTRLNVKSLFCEGESWWATWERTKQWVARGIVIGLAKNFHRLVPCLRTSSGTSPHMPLSCFWEEVKCCWY